MWYDRSSQRQQQQPKVLRGQESKREREREREREKVNSRPVYMSNRLVSTFQQKLCGDCDRKSRRFTSQFLTHSCRFIFIFTLVHSVAPCFFVFFLLFLVRFLSHSVLLTPWLGHREGNESADSYNSSVAVFIPPSSSPLLSFYPCFGRSRRHFWTAEPFSPVTNQLLPGRSAILTSPRRDVINVA